MLKESDLMDKAKRANQCWWFAKRDELCLRIRPGGVSLATRDERKRWRVDHGWNLSIGSLPVFGQNTSDVR
jgi:hypothetical protein